MALVELVSTPDRLAAEALRAWLLAEEGDWLELFVFDAGAAGLGLGPMMPARVMADESAADYLRDKYPNELARFGSRR